MADLVILVGFRGVGKTTIGKALAKALGYEFLDTDAEIVRQRGEDVADIVDNEGWPAFRRYEKGVLASLASRSNLVAATGGGAVVHEGIWVTLQKKAVVIWLTADEKVILKRLINDTATSSQRPALEGGDVLAEIPEILKQRIPLYEQVAHYRIDTGILTVGDAVLEICRLVNKHPL